MTDPNHPQPGHPTPHHAPYPPPQRPGPLPPPGSPRPSIAAPPSMAISDHDLEPLTLVEDRQPTHMPAGPPPPKKIQAFGMGDAAHIKKHDWKRQPTKNGTGACRVKSFHGKYSEQGLDYLDNAINEWLDAHPEVEVKFVTPTVMTFEGKIREPALVLNLWY